MKLKYFATISKNSRNKQISFCLKAKKLKEKGITPEQLIEVEFVVKPKIKFMKNE